eukprot:CAMPEP_0113411586 /NCGR_PEP_ID=MMETSP0013_2-20120614/22343_1 /TAXON_ID=2843 ORGANISM="Skeletonema costatum, Strain 1716" /NCGR_SAMPLE_ID=MMETSP0013_2 /ASSEMBLY_ACC=CAM_ASM_000158 /LENGTH=1273 /DNA_ID=CAMNT_0000297947 /DNA_START=4 /DNA_END=3822 /DNA_ORIENTATION=- /assembly_acc=CAM_ASM_000158
MAVQVVNEGTAAVSDTAVAPPSTSSTSSALKQESSPSDEKLMPLLLRIILTDPDEETTTATINNTATNNNNNLRDLSLTKAVSTLSTAQLLSQLALLDDFRRSPENNLYQRVRALFFLYAVHRFHLPERRRVFEKRRLNGKSGDGESSKSETHEGVEKTNNQNENGKTKDATFICRKGYSALVDRRFDDAIDHFLEWVSSSSSTMTLSTDEEDDCITDNEKGGRFYPVPRTTSLISNLTFSRHGPSPITTTTTAATAAVDDASLSRGHSSSIASSSTSSSHVSDEVTTPPPPMAKQHSTKEHSKTTTNASTPQHQQQQTLLLPSEATSSALAKSYRSLAFQTLADQVKRSVRSHDGNEWMFNVADVGDTPLSWSEELLLEGSGEEEDEPMLVERTPVRMDLSHSCWSDIFFLGMDYPEAARVVNCSVDLAVHQRETGVQQREPTPPIECRLQLTTTNPGTIQLRSIDLNASVVMTHVSQVFDFGADYLGLLKAGLVASGIVPPGLEEACVKNGQDMPLSELLVNMLPPSQQHLKVGLELTTFVKNIPKGSRLAVSTNLLGSIISVGMRATKQTACMDGPLCEEERRLVAARAILGEWIGGSGGGWQDSGGVWPGLKLIHGVKSRLGDPEYGVSRGRLLPKHKLLNEEDAPPSLLKALENSLVLVHGGQSMNVGPVLEMVTEKYLLRDEEEWHARHRSIEILDEMMEAFRRSDVKEIGRCTTENFLGPVRSVIPWATNKYTETLIERVASRFGDRFWGFCMHGGASGGGMGFIFDPSAKEEAVQVLGDIMLQTKKEMEHCVPFAMDPCVFDYKVNDHGTVAQLCQRNDLPELLQHRSKSTESQLGSSTQLNLDALLVEQGFDMSAQEQIRSDLKDGRIGLAKNRLSQDCEVKDVIADDVIVVDEDSITDSMLAIGQEALRSGTVGVVTLAAGVGSRWTNGAGVVKALNPYCCIGGKHSSFLDVHLAKNRRVSAEVGMRIPHVFTTSWMTDLPITEHFDSMDKDESIYISTGKSIGLRMIPMVKDLQCLWEEQPRLDEQAQKVRDSVHTALASWAQAAGEASDYRDNVPQQCLSPVGHWYEIPNMLLNGTLAKMLEDRPQLKTLMLHNIDTIGATVDAGIIGKFLETKSTLAYEVVPRCVDDMGGGLCKIDDKVRLVEGLALATEEDELKFSYYNSLTTWIDIDSLLDKFGLTRNDILERSDRIPSAINNFSRRLPTYITIKDVKKRLGKGHEDIHPVCQYEKLWGDMSSMDDCSFFVVPRIRGQQLKDISQLDG